MQKVIAIVGPTASGKTAFSLALAKHFKGIVISADSRQVYKEMQVNTATPAGTWRAPNAYYRHFLGPKKRYHVQDIPHFLMDEVAPNEAFTLADYQRRVNDELAALRRHEGATPVFLVGGTGLYIDAVCQGFVLPTFSARRRAKLAKKPLPELLRMLKKLDSATWRVIDRKNPRRVLRAVEASMAGVPFSAQRKKAAPAFDVLYLGLNPARSVLEKHLRLRAKTMFKAGLLAETKRLMKRYAFTLPALSAIGYADAARVARGEMTKQEAVDRRVTADMQYAKRQMTWFKRNTKIHWNLSPAAAVKFVQRFLA
ncbi:MAG: tRNA (adenosine(37)-N6)-dimethylallyltransferase MiaA [Patescibacteria group bacterium]|jgi:tRNA dimethylallyltransferase